MPSSKHIIIVFLTFLCTSLKFNGSVLLHIGRCFASKKNYVLTDVLNMHVTSLSCRLSNFNILRMWYN
jgi:hypothetical protein